MPLSYVSHFVHSYFLRSAQIITRLVVLTPVDISFLEKKVHIMCNQKHE